MYQNPIGWAPSQQANRTGIILLRNVMYRKLFLILYNPYFRKIIAKKEPVP